MPTPRHRRHWRRRTTARRSASFWYATTLICPSVRLKSSQLTAAAASRPSTAPLYSTLHSSHLRIRLPSRRSAMPAVHATSGSKRQPQSVLLSVRHTRHAPISSSPSAMTRDKRRRVSAAPAASQTPPSSAASASQQRASPPTTSKLPPWRRILYEQQPYPDNYTPADWLSAMSSYSSSPAESEYRPYGAVVWLTLILASRASILTLFLVTFYTISQHAISSRALLTLDVAVAAVLLAIHFSLSPLVLSPSASSSSSLSSPTPLSVASVCLLCLLLLLVSPLLSTLTWSYSSDTIYLLVLLLSAAHLLSFDYGSINSPIAQQPALLQSAAVHSASSGPAGLPSPSFSIAPLAHPVSLNCALLLSLLLASRLSSPLHVSLLLLLSSLLFAVSPSQQQLLCCWSATAHLLSVVLLSLLCCYMLCVYVAVLLAAVYVLCVLSVCFVCPWWLLRVQRYKRTIHGPWDYNDEPETSSAENL